MRSLARHVCYAKAAEVPSGWTSSPESRTRIEPPSAIRGIRCTEEYSEHGVHVANVIIDGMIDSSSTRALPRAQQHPEVVMNPVKIAEAFWYLHTQEKSCWTHELQLTPFSTKPNF